MHRFSSLPQPVVSPGASTWTLPKRPEALADGLIYHIQTSSSLQTWVNAGSAGSSSTVLQDTSSILTIRLNLDQRRSFMRFDPVIPPGL